MTSRDGTNRSNRPYRPGTGQQGSKTPPAQFGLDADELDRYMSGQQAREPRFDPYGRPQTSGQTERIPAQRTSAPAQPENYPPYDDETWDDAGYEESYEYDVEVEYEPEPQPAPRRSASRQRQRVQEYDDDLYEDPYVLDDEEIEERPRQRRQQSREPRARQQRPAANLAVPAFLAEAPLLKDRISLGMLVANLLSVIILIIIVATRRDGLGSVIITHVDANGAASSVEDSSAIWRLPLIAAMVTIINATVAWFLARWSMFLPRFLLGGAIGVQFVVWVAIIAHLF